MAEGNKIYTLKKYNTSTYLNAQYACGLGTPSVLSEEECVAIIKEMGLFKFKGKLEVYRHYREYYMDTYDFDENRKKYLPGVTLVTDTQGVNFPPFHYFIESATIGTVIGMILRLQLDEAPLLKPVAKVFGFGQSDVFTGYLFRLKEIRNRCAHNGRIFNRNYRGVKVPKPYKKHLSQTQTHRAINVWMSLFLLMDKLSQYSAYQEFEEKEVASLLNDFLHDRQSNIMLSSLPHNFPEGQWSCLKKFILEGMGKKKKSQAYTREAWRR